MADEGRTHFVGDGCEGGHEEVSGRGPIVQIVQERLSALERVAEAARETVRMFPGGEAGILPPWARRIFEALQALDEGEK